MNFSKLSHSYPLSHLQQGILFHSLYEEEKGLYIQQIVAQLNEKINLNLFEQSWQQVLNRHEILRTNLSWENLETPVQIVNSEIKFNLNTEDWSHLTTEKQQEKFTHFLTEDRDKGFDFKEAPLMRLFICKLADCHYKMLWTFHHILLDGRSFTLILKEVFTIYQAKLKGENINLNEPIPYHNYINWLEKQDLKKAEDFWQKQFKNFTTPTSLTIKKIGQDEPSNKKYATETLNLSRELTEKLQIFVKENNLTLNTLIQGAWSLLLSRYSGEEDIVFGAVRACRHTVDNAESMIGLLINTVPVRIRVSPEETVLSYLNKIRQNWLKMRDFETTPLTKIQQLINLPANIPLFESLLVFENYQLNEHLQQQGNQWKNRDFQLFRQGHYPLNMGAYNGEQLCLKIGYQTEQFDQFMIEKMLDHLQTLLDGMINKPDETISGLPLESKIENKHFSCVLIGWESLLIECAKLLTANGHKICGIISSSKLVKKWAEKQNIPYETSLEKSKQFLFERSFDYLFSIYNLEIIPEEILTLPTKHSINCHNALLPKYSGLHAPSWAIFHGEKQHGITWHLMTSEIDSGDILKQVSFDIANDETAFTLSIKCYEAVISSFQNLIDHLASEKITLTPQNLAERTFFYGYQKPLPGCIISWELKAEQIDRLVRALTFGTIPNSLGLPKLYIGGQFWLFKKIKIEKQSSKLPSGTIVAIENNYLRITTITDDIIFYDLSTIKGESVSVIKLLDKYNIKIGEGLPDIDEQVKKRLLELENKLFKHEKFWVEQILNLQDIQATFVNQKADCTINTSQIKEQEWLIPDEIITFINNHPQKWKQDSFLLVVFVTYLARICQTDNFDIGIRINSLTQKLTDLESLFSLDLPLKIKLKNYSFDEFFSRIQKQVKSIEKQQTFSRDMVLRYPEISKQKNLKSQLKLDIVVQITEQLNHQNTLEFNNPLTFVISKQKQKCKFIYDETKINNTTINWLLNNLTIFSQNIVSNSSQFINKISLLSKQQLNQILREGNQTTKDYLKNKSIHQLFEEQVFQTPNNLAVVFEDKKLTYQELNEKANQLAHYLQKLGVKPETLVGICIERSLEMIIGIFGILKAGGAYIPIDPNYPTKRKKLLLEEANFPLVLTQANVLNQLKGIETKIICLDEEWEVISSENIDNPKNDLKLSHLAYVIYTSGSTGKPKGVMIEHKSLSYFAQTIITECSIHSSDRLLQFANITFDAAVEEIFPCLICGATLILRTEEMLRNIRYFVQQAEDWQLTVLDLPTAYWHLLVTELAERKFILPEFLRLVIIGGEKAITNKFNLWLNIVGDQITLINTYGPTETTVTATIYQVFSQKRLSEIPLGYPLPYVQTYILDQYLQLLPIGTIGEIYIGGDGVARGYLNREQLTAEKFIPNPFGEGKLYKTGDLARYLPDGNIEFIGRIDNQVKIRGFRIELGEIETTLNQHPQIKETVVIAKENAQGDKYLVAYLITKEEISVKEIRQFLSKNLPDYMIPAAFVFLDSFPLNPNGKIDRKALPEPDFELTRENEFIPPRNSTELTLVNIWQQVLKIEKIGINDNFFELGGHSLLATQIISRIRNNFQIELALRYLFQEPTIAQLAELIDNLCWTQLNQISLDSENLEEGEI